MADLHHLYGSCACERNQYTIIVPDASASLAQVFFDNSAANRRSQATPVTAWLRVPLDWYHSSTFALFPDESHLSIKRTFHTPSLPSADSTTRRQFCGYCGTHLTAWNEGHDNEGDAMDVTLGSLLGESLQRLEALNLLPMGEVVDDVESAPASNAERPVTDRTRDGTSDQAVRLATSSTASRRMRNRGMPYFEEMVENSRLGMIKRQKGGHWSRDGTTSVEWEVVEFDGSDEPMTGTSGDDGSAAHKRLKMNA